MKINRKKRKSSSSAPDDSAPAAAAAAGKMSYEEVEEKLHETESELLETKDQLQEAEAKIVSLQANVESLQKSKGGGDDDDDEDISDDEGSDELDSNDPWISKYLELREYRKMNGDCKVPMNYATNPKLGVWVNNQKLRYANLKNGKSGTKITEERINMLDGLGFFWGKKYLAPWSWDEGFEELHKFQKAMGHCNVHVAATNPSRLAKWVSAQRVEYKHFRKGGTTNTLLELEQVEKLRDIGFKFKGPRLS